MHTSLSRLLDEIDPRRTLDEIVRRADGALLTWDAPRSRITDWDSFRHCLVKFHRYVEEKILGLANRYPDMGLEFHWGRCIGILQRAFGNSGAKAAFELARTGVEGGLYRVLRDIARVTAEEYAQNELSARIWHYWNALSTEERLAAPDEYLRKYGHLLPEELTERGAARIRADFPKVLQEHPRLIQRIRDIAHY